MNPILLDFPSSFDTKRLRIRKPFPGDGEEINAAIRASIDDLKPWLPFAQNIPEVEETEAKFREAHAKFLRREDLCFLIFDKETGHFIGSTGLHRINWDIPKFEIGYWIHSAYRNKGYMTEAVEGLCTFAFSKLQAKRLEIRCDSTNTASRNVAKRLEFTLEGILYHDSLSADKSELRHTCIYAKLADTPEIVV
ncbi:GNAT family N-acetyltransferase [Priestia taiwanensis]|uniref:Ribosomal-protein-serine acetyltransferase n=1 Tax=Priestia taiwanensis TaxID=1347902 RepID=A0A917AIW8_9BACI|nr:GNAT family N-acetyltransferase [Priestia taiwanensis]MBM7361461.1 RimJ/RimL family protein N-acetyltransferase [Priestia taiwanensis]GGE54324.1 ribosomal-protein-serine acetyltransferase [Priestia taiwanensis]